MNKCYCGNESLEEYSEGYFKCSKCNTLVSKHDFSKDTYHVKEEDNDLYGKNYWEVTMVQAAGKKNLSELVDMYLSERVVYWIKYILRYLKPGAAVAEVGCGLGQLQYVMKQLEYEQLAFELSPYICDYMEKELHIKTQCGPFSAGSSQFDGILAFDLFEHLDEPEAFLEECAKALKPNGVLCFQTPCFDGTLTYDQMLQKKERFQEQLKERQHVFLYSREAIQQLLRKYGFEYLIFEPAIFGDDYDMFFFASKVPLKKNTDEEIDLFLNQVANGRLVKAMITLYDAKEELAKENAAISEEREKQLRDVEKLTDIVADKQTMLEKQESAASERLKLVQRISEENKELHDVADDRLKLVEKVSDENTELRNAANLRLELIESLSTENADMHRVADERLELVEKLSAENAELQKTADERLELVEKLSVENAELQKAADERLELVEKLSVENAELQKAADERLELVEKLSAELSAL